MKYRALPVASVMDIHIMDICAIDIWRQIATACDWYLTGPP